jgi:hypothetical protein
MQPALQEELRRRPSVHQLCYGPFLQETIRLDSDVLAVPLQPFGFKGEAEYLSRYLKDCLGGQVEASRFAELCASAENALPVIALCVSNLVEGSVELLEDLVRPRLERSRLVLSWATGDNVVPFAVATATLSSFYFRLLPPSSRYRRRLGFGNTGADFQSQIERIAKATASDEHFSFALALLHDALHEPNHLFRIARLFNVLESLAANLKTETFPSRKAVRYMLESQGGMNAKVQSQLTFRGTQIDYDPVEIGGRVRDKLFHGVPFRREDLNAEARPVFDVLSKEPQLIADTVLALCELEVARWANGKSLGQIVPG